MNTTAVAALLTELGAHTPRLPQAACRNHTDLFDSQQPDDIAAAKHLCQHHCPELARCTEWFNSLPPNQQPDGVVAGRLIQPPAPRPQPPPKPRQPTKTSRATNWLANYLSTGPVISTQVRADAVAAGIDLHTLTRARRALGVQLDRTAETRGGQWIWRACRTTPTMKGTP